MAYLVPLLISLITLFVELFADRCAIFKPRFTETGCFFSGNTSKIIWLYTPIALSLFFSIWNFILTVRAVMAVDKETSRFTQRSDSSSSFVETACCGRRTLQKDRFYMFLKHFIGKQTLYELFTKMVNLYFCLHLFMSRHWNLVDFRSDFWHPG